MTAELGSRSVPELEEERDHLLASLDRLDRELADGDMERADYDVLKDDYTVRAAAVLRAIEEARPGRSSRRPASGPAPEGRPARWRRAWLGAALLGSVTLVAVAGVLVTRSAEERRPGEAATGDIAAPGPTGDPTGDVAQDLARARQLREEGQTLAAIKLYDVVLAQDPNQPEALAYRGWLVRLAGRQSANPDLVDTGLEYLNRAVAADPSYPWAHFFRGLVLYEDKRDPASAAPELRAFLATGPPPAMLPAVQQLLGQVEAEAGGRAGSAPAPAPSSP